MATVTLKLTKDYTLGKTKFLRHKPTEVDEATARYLDATGFFEVDLGRSEPVPVKETPKGGVTITRAPKAKEPPKIVEPVDPDEESVEIGE